MPTLDCRGCMECVEDHLLFICVIISSCSRQHVLVPVHVCSTAPGKEVSGSLYQGIALLCGPKPWSHFPDAPFRNIVQSVGVPKLFAMLLDKFHIGL